MRSITTVIQYIYKYKTQKDYVVSDTNAFINFLTSVHGHTKKGTHIYNGRNLKLISMPQ